jgi:hypothetical protein
MGNIVLTGAPHTRIRHDYKYMYPLQARYDFCQRVWMAGIVPRGAEVPNLNRNNYALHTLFSVTREFLVGMLNALVGDEDDHRPTTPASAVQYYLSRMRNTEVDLMTPTAATLLQRFSFVRPPADPVRTLEDRWAGMYDTRAFRFWNVIQVKLEPGNRIHDHVSHLFHVALTLKEGAQARLFVPNAYMLIFYFQTDQGTVVRFVREYLPRAAYESDPNSSGYLSAPLPRPDVVPTTNFQNVLVLYRLDRDADALSLLNHPQGPDHRLLPLRPLGIRAYRPEVLACYPIDHVWIRSGYVRNNSLGYDAALKEAWVVGFLLKWENVPKYVFDYALKTLFMQFYKDNSSFLSHMLDGLLGTASEHGESGIRMGTVFRYYKHNAQTPSINSLLERFGFIFPTLAQGEATEVESVTPDEVERTVIDWHSWSQNSPEKHFAFWKVIKITFDEEDSVHRALDTAFNAFVFGPLDAVFFPSEFFYLFYVKTKKGTVVRYVRVYKPPMGPASSSMQTNPLVVILYKEPALGDSLGLLNRADGHGHEHLRPSPLGIPGDGQLAE